MHFISNFVKGIFIGTGAILPGISSGVICVILGIYQKLLDSILGFFHNVHTSIQFLLPIALGSFVGIIIFSNCIRYYLNMIPIQINSLFMGLLLGSLSTLAQINLKKDQFTFNYSKWFSFFICFFIGFLFIFLECKMHFTNNDTTNEFSFIYLVISGFLMSMGIVIPGVSSTIILMILRVYPAYISALSLVNIHVLFPILIGIGIGSLFFMKMIQKLLNNFYSQTIWGIIGFSLGSIFILYPTYSFNIESLIGIFLLILGFMIGKKIK